MGQGQTAAVLQGARLPAVERATRRPRSGGTGEVASNISLILPHRLDWRAPRSRPCRMRLGALQGTTTGGTLLDRVNWHCSVPSHLTSGSYWLLVTWWDRVRGPCKHRNREHGPCPSTRAKHFHLPGPDLRSLKTICIPGPPKILRKAPWACGPAVWPQWLSNSQVASLRMLPCPVLRCIPITSIEAFTQSSSGLMLLHFVVHFGDSRHVLILFSLKTRNTSSYYTCL